MTEPEIVPFGKYKGRPIEYMLADRSYCEWLAAQPWFRERFTPVYNIIIGTGTEPQDSPEHNAMQARFLDHHESLRLAERWLPTGDALHAEWTPKADRLTDKQRANLVVGDHGYRIDAVAFESGGWDLVVRASAVLDVREVSTERTCICECGEGCIRRMYRNEGFQRVQVEVDRDLTQPVHLWSECFSAPSRRSRHCADDCPVTWDATDSTWPYVDRSSPAYCYDRAKTPVRVGVHVAVELKPVVGDDYPTILRAVLRRFAAGRRAERNVVLADRVEFSTVTLDQVRRIFASQHVTFLTTAELATGLRCGCPTC